MTQVNTHEIAVGLLPGVGKAAYVSKSGWSSAILPVLLCIPSLLLEDAALGVKSFRVNLNSNLKTKTKF